MFTCCVYMLRLCVSCVCVVSMCRGMRCVDIQWRNMFCAKFCVYVLCLRVQLFVVVRCCVMCCGLGVVLCVVV